MLEELWASDYYYYKSLEYELRVYNADKADKEIERLKKKKEWLIDRCVKNELYIHNLWVPDQLSEKERREKITKEMHQVLMGE